MTSIIKPLQRYSNLVTLLRLLGTFIASYGIKPSALNKKMNAELDKLKAEGKVSIEPNNKNTTAQVITQALILP